MGMYARRYVVSKVVPGKGSRPILLFILVTGLLTPIISVYYDNAPLPQICWLFEQSLVAIPKLLDFRRARVNTNFEQGAA